MSSSATAKGHSGPNGDDPTTATHAKAGASPTATTPSQPPPPEPAPPAPRDWAWGAIVVIAGLIAIVAVFIFAVFEYKQAAEVTTAVGAVSGVIAALVGAYFGIRGATLAQANSESSGASRPAPKL